MGQIVRGDSLHFKKREEKKMTEKRTQVGHEEVHELIRPLRKLWDEDALVCLLAASLGTMVSIHADGDEKLKQQAAEVSRQVFERYAAFNYQIVDLGEDGPIWGPH